MVVVLWRRHDVPGHEHASVTREGDQWIVSGVALFEHEQQPCRLSYVVRCDSDWRTRSARVAGSVGERQVDVNVVVDRGEWILNGTAQTVVKGCIDVDLNFSPSTNLLPIRRLALNVGDQRGVRAAWLRFPSFALEPLDQTYSRIAERVYRYESAGGRFVAQIEVDDNGLPLRYGDLWSAECASSS